MSFVYILIRIKVKVNKYKLSYNLYNNFDGSSH